MPNEHLELALWAAGFVLSTALFLTLLGTGRAASQPWFTAWIAFGCLNTVGLFLASRSNIHRLYFRLYWSSAFIDLGLQLLVIFEIAASVLKRKGAWVEKAGFKLAVWSFVSLITASLASVLVKPATTNTADAFFGRMDLFTTLEFCCTFMSVMFISRQLGLYWRGLPARIGYGLAAWNCVSFLSDNLHTYWSALRYFDQLEYIRDLSFIVAVVYWIRLSLRADLPLTSNHEPTSAEELLSLKDHLGFSPYTERT